MTKQEQLIEYVTQDLIELIVMNQKVEYDEAMNLLYNSETFDKLSDVETGLYSESPAYVYGIFQGIKTSGRLFRLNCKQEFCSSCMSNFCPTNNMINVTGGIMRINTK